MSCQQLAGRRRRRTSSDDSAGRRWCSWWCWLVVVEHARSTAVFTERSTDEARRSTEDEQRTKKNNAARLNLGRGHGCFVSDSVSDWRPNVLAQSQGQIFDLNFDLQTTLSASADLEAKISVSLGIGRTSLISVWKVTGLIDHGWTDEAWWSTVVCRRQLHTLVITCHLPWHSRSFIAGRAQLNKPKLG